MLLLNIVGMKFWENKDLMEALEIISTLLLIIFAAIAGTLFPKFLISPDSLLSKIFTLDGIFMITLIGISFSCIILYMSKINKDELERERFKELYKKINNIEEIVLKNKNETSTIKK